MGAGYLDWFGDTLKPIIFGDSQSSIVLANTSIPTKRTKHMLLRLHMVRDHAENIAYCPTGLNMADPLTKPMSKPMMMFQIPLSESLPERKEHGFFVEYYNWLYVACI